MTDIESLILAGSIPQKVEETYFHTLLSSPELVDESVVELAEKRFRNPAVSLESRVAAGALLYSRTNADAFMETVINADAEMEPAAAGALAKLISLSQDNKILSSQENLTSARDVVLNLLTSDQDVLRKWAAYAAVFVAFDIGQVPPDGAGLPSQRVIERMELAASIETNDKIKSLLNENLQELRGLQTSPPK